MVDATIVTSFNRTESKIGKVYEQCALRFMKSLRKNGGQCKDLPVKIWIDKEKKPDKYYIDTLLGFGNCELFYGNLEIPQPTKSGSTSSKLYAVSECRSTTKYAAWMDIDFFFLDDFSWLFEQDVDILAPTMNLQSNFGASEKFSDMWDKYYAYFGLTRPDHTVTTLVDKKPSNFYFTSGLMVYKTNVGFEDTYKNVCDRIYYSDLPYNDFRFSQTAVPITINMLNLSWKQILKRYYHMYHLNNYSLDDDTVIVHYCADVVKEIPSLEWNV